MAERFLLVSSILGIPGSAGAAMQLFMTVNRLLKFAAAGDTSVCLGNSPFAELTALGVVELGYFQSFEAGQIIIQPPGKDQVIHIVNGEPVLRLSLEVPFATAVLMVSTFREIL